MAVIEDTSRQLYPRDGDGAISVQDILDTGAGGEGGTVPALATAAELQAGTVTEARLVSPKLLADEIDRRIAAAAG